MQAEGAKKVERWSKGGREDHTLRFDSHIWRGARLCLCPPPDCVFSRRSTRNENYAAVHQSSKLCKACEAAWQRHGAATSPASRSRGHHSTEHLDSCDHDPAHLPTPLRPEFLNFGQLHRQYHHQYRRKYHSSTTRAHFHCDPLHVGASAKTINLNVASTLRISGHVTVLRIIGAKSASTASDSRSPTNRFSAHYNLIIIATSP